MTATTIGVASTSTSRGLAAPVGGASGNRNGLCSLLMDSFRGRFKSARDVEKTATSRDVTLRRNEMTWQALRNYWKESAERSAFDWFASANAAIISHRLTDSDMAARSFHVKRYLLTGLLTFVPLWLTWVVFKLVFGLLSEVSTPLVGGLVGTLGDSWPDTARILSQSWLISLIAFVITLLALYLVGFAANFVLGRRLIDSLEALIQRIPVVQTIYGGTKKLMSVLQNKPSGTQRVVMIDFPSPGLKAVGFVTRVFHDANGRELAAVYVPTTPNPTGGYLEIVPIERLTATDWTVDQAMAFILSAGAVAPDTLPFSTEWNDTAQREEVAKSSSTN
jgi:uncharacterized membrane protein